ncbi:putative phospholipid-transporting ATPase 9 [Zea mays]|uniref:Phospholipid-transporting ATPase n=1 Tax=Zea mays TaxID=4577 RepID=A0A1D6LY09_MAIZE|nr:putative phospholipid-transporting ATPase 9 [Zea mays]AQK84052.1 Putative phospholipid-transporting ATPase 9 [Zea mays]|eukprot:XP_008649337.1 putative phospholipid-transporting ATPase 9 [Zea mays]
MAPTKRLEKLKLSTLLTFMRCHGGSSDDHLRIGTVGFSRVVYVNEPDRLEEEGFSYLLNEVSTTKYNLATFLPKSLFEQFRRVANFYFLVSGILALTPLAPYTAVSALAPLCVVIVATMAKEGVEDWRRKQQDHELNNRIVKVHRGNGHFEESKWKNIKVGDVIKVEKDNFFPADMILLSSNYPDGICYVETMNLDGETNLKIKQALKVTLDLHEDIKFREVRQTIKCEDPNANLYSFVGSMEWRGQQYPLSSLQLLLRDSKLRNTDYIYGAVIFTGHDTKVMQNATDPPSKRSKVEKKMDQIIYLLMSSLLMIALLGSVFFGIWTKEDLRDGELKRWYLRPDATTIFYDPKRAALASFFHLLTSLMLYSYFIPISLYISIEMVKILQALFINQDIRMYHEESDKPTHARTSNLNEELGMVDTILSDKTGTLTCNMMEFIKCSIAGTAYGQGVTEVERAMAMRKGARLDDDIENGDHKDKKNDNSPHVKGFNFKDQRIMDGKWVHEPNRVMIRDFFRLLAICHTCIAEIDENEKVSYEAESPDEAAFVIAARELGFEFYKRSLATIIVRERNPSQNVVEKRKYELLNMLEFSSSRSRMSVIVKEPEGRILLLSKGADSVMFKRLAPIGRKFEEETRSHINQYSDSGLRTFVLAYRVLDEKEYKEFNEKLNAAKASVSADKDEKIEQVADSIERDLILLGATAVEDKLQQGVPECIDKLAQAGIKMWVLTGDKLETAINIGFACSLLRQGMTQIIVTLEQPDIIALEKNGDKPKIAKASKQRVMGQIEDGIKQIPPSTQISTASFALIIDGKSLTYALEDDVKFKFLDLALKCASVICCRSSPKQKALVTRLVKEVTHKVTLAIGDGANDVGMLQEADIGVGISGAEGMQAVMASDVAVAQFRFLERLLLVHGHWCYRRISLMICYFFYKNVTFGVTIFLYEAFASFSGKPAYNDWFLSLYNVFFTSLPVIALGVFDQDVSARLCIQYPQLYQEGVQNILFSWRRILGWMFNGVMNAVLIFFFCITAFEDQAFRRDGQVAGLDALGVVMYTCIVWVVNCQMALSVNYFTIIQHIFIWGSIAVWYLFLLVYGAINPRFSTTAYMVFIEQLAPALSFWLVTLFVVVATLVPYFSYAAIQIRFFPMFHNKIQWKRYLGKAEDPEVARQLSSKHRTSLQHRMVGISARRDGKAVQITKETELQVQE